MTTNFLDTQLPKRI